MDIDEILDMDTDDIRRSHLIVSKSWKHITKLSKNNKEFVNNTKLFNLYLKF